jgi:transposase
MHAGVAPLDTSSGRRQRDYRHSRVGNRRLNRALHVIALTQLRHDPDAAAYYQRKIAGGASKRMALRALKRRVARRVFHLLRAVDQPVPQPTPAAAAA